MKAWEQAIIQQRSDNKYAVIKDLMVGGEMQDHKREYISHLFGLQIPGDNICWTVWKVKIKITIDSRSLYWTLGKLVGIKKYKAQGIDVSALKPALVEDVGFKSIYQIDGGNVAVHLRYLQYSLKTISYGKKQPLKTIWLKKLAI